MKHWIIGAFLLCCSPACNKCGHCELNGTSDNYYCQGSNKEAYDATKTACERAHGTWVVK